MKEIKLSTKYNTKNSKLNLVALVDDSDYKKLSQWNWSVREMGNTYYAVRQDAVTGKIIRMHRQIMNTPDGMDCDHIDHNGLNCQRANMRNCSHSENLRNGSAHKDSRSKFKGVGFHEIRNDKPLWRARIQINKKNTHLGCFESEIDAALAYNEAAIKHHGEFANLNTVAV